MKKLQIRNVDSEGCGSFDYIDIEDNTPKKDIEISISILLTERKKRHESAKFFGWSPLFLKRKMKIVEIKDNKAVRGGIKGYAKLRGTVLSGVNIITNEKFTSEMFSFHVEIFDKDNNS